MARLNAVVWNEMQRPSFRLEGIAGLSSNEWSDQWDLLVLRGLGLLNCELVGSTSPVKHVFASATRFGECFFR